MGGTIQQSNVEWGDSKQLTVMRMEVGKCASYVALVNYIQTDICTYVAAYSHMHLRAWFLKGLPIYYN